MNVMFIEVNLPDNILLMVAMCSVFQGVAMFYCFPNNERLLVDQQVKVCVRGIELWGISFWLDDYEQIEGENSADS